MTTYDRVKKLDSVVRSMIDMYAGGKTGTDERGIMIAKGYELQAIAMIKGLWFEDMSSEVKALFDQALDHFKYFRQLKFKAYVAANEETPAFDCIYSQTESGAEKELREKIGKYANSLFFWTVFVHETGQEEKL